MSSTIPKTVYIAWVDSMGFQLGWNSRDEAKLPRISTLAFLVKETDEAYYLSHSYSPLGPVHYDLFAIPKGCVVEYHELDLFVEEDGEDE